MSLERKFLKFWLWKWDLNLRPPGYKFNDLFGSKRKLKWLRLSSTYGSKNDNMSFSTESKSAGHSSEARSSGGQASSLLSFA